MARNAKQIKSIVKQGYSKVAKQGISCCSSSGCCGGTDSPSAISKSVGYSDKEMKSIPDGANLGLGCGNPVAIASLKKGEVVLDLGSGAGFDAFLASPRVGAVGRVIGVDMTPAMVKRAKANAVKGNYKNVEFRQGEIEKLPVEDGVIDAIISNCVINLSPNKKQVFKEAFRVLKPGGRIMLSDLVLARELPVKVKKAVEAYVGCLAGAIMKDKYLDAIKQAGFKKVTVVRQDEYPVQDQGMAGAVISIKVSAVKPKGAGR
jgi:SAM-dependent methyltransferase